MEETHERMRGIKGSYKNVLKTVELIRKIEGIYTGFVFTFTPQNYREFKSVLTLSKGMKMAVTFQFAQTSSHYYDNREIHFDWTKEQIDEVRDILKETHYFEYVLDFQLHQKRNFDCYSGTHSCFLDPYGNVFPCIYLEKSIGNIREQDFDTLWASPGAMGIRESISQRQCHCCSFCDIPNSLPRNLSVITSNIKNMLKSG